MRTNHLRLRLLAVVSATLAALSMMLSITGLAFGAQDQGCTNSFAPIELNTGWDGEGVPEAGEDAWWDLTLAGFTAEGLSIDQAAELFGFDGQPIAFYEFILGVLRVDANLNGIICYKSFPPQQNGTPAYIFGVTDDKHLKHL